MWILRSETSWESRSTGNFKSKSFAILRSSLLAQGLIAGKRKPLHFWEDFDQGEQSKCTLIDSFRNCYFVLDLRLALPKSLILLSSCLQSWNQSACSQFTELSLESWWLKEAYLTWSGYKRCKMLCPVHNQNLWADHTLNCLTTFALHTCNSSLN